MDHILIHLEERLRTSGIPSTGTPTTAWHAWTRHPAIDPTVGRGVGRTPDEALADLAIRADVDHSSLESVIYPLIDPNDVEPYASWIRTAATLTELPLTARTMPAWRRLARVRMIALTDAGDDLIDELAGQDPAGIAFFLDQHAVDLERLMDMDGAEVATAASGLFTRPGTGDPITSVGIIRLRQALSPLHGTTPQTRTDEALAIAGAIIGRWTCVVEDYAEDLARMEPAVAFRRLEDGCHITFPSEDLVTIEAPATTAWADLEAIRHHLTRTLAYHLAWPQECSTT